MMDVGVYNCIVVPSGTAFIPRIINTNHLYERLLVVDKLTDT
jgi:hypothetical protein